MASTAKSGGLIPLRALDISNAAEVRTQFEAHAPHVNALAAAQARVARRMQAASSSLLEYTNHLAALVHEIEAVVAAEAAIGAAGDPAGLAVEDVFEDVCAFGRDLAALQVCLRLLWGGWELGLRVVVGVGTGRRLGVVGASDLSWCDLMRCYQPQPADGCRWLPACLHSWLTSPNLFSAAA